MQTNGRAAILALLLLVFAGRSAAQTVDAGYAVGTWRYFRPAAVSHTFDDNVRNQLAVAVPMFDEFGYRLTLFALTEATSSWAPPDWEGMAAAAAAGHEIASHTVTHPRLNELPLDRQEAELRDSRRTIEEKISGPAGLTLAYPYCVAGDASLTAEYYIAARACQGSVERSTPRDMLNVSSIIVGSEGSVRTAANLISRAREAIASGGWTVFLFHGIDNDGGYSPIPSAEIRKYLVYMKANEEDFWVETFGNVVRYIRERDAATVAEVSAGEDRITVQVSDTLDDAIYAYPLTLRRVLPPGWEAAAVTQDGVPVEARIVEAGAEKHVEFDAVPDAGEVVIERRTATGVETGEAVPQRSYRIEPYPNPFDRSATLVYQVSRPGMVRLEVFDVLGRRLAVLVNQVLPAGRYTVDWNASRHSAGAYAYRYEESGEVTSGMMLFAP